MSEEDTVYAERLSDGTIVQIMPDGSRRVMEDTSDWDYLNSMTEEEIDANAASDPDNPPLTEEELDRIFPRSAVRTLRRRLNLSQEEFSRRFEIPVGTIRDWEQGKKRPDSAARALIKVIEHAPDTVLAALRRE